MMHPRALGRVSRVALAATVCTFLLSVAAWGGSSFAEASRVFEEQITSDLRARD